MAVIDIHKDSSDSKDSKVNHGDRISLSVKVDILLEIKTRRMTSADNTMCGKKFFVLSGSMTALDVRGYHSEEDKVRR